MTESLAFQPSSQHARLGKIYMLKKNPLSIFTLSVRICVGSFTSSGLLLV